MDTKIRFINKSSSTTAVDVIICQFPTASAIAWQVFKKCPIGWIHPFTFPLINYIEIIDPYGNISPQLEANAGDSFVVADSPSGVQFVRAGSSTDSNFIEVQDKLSQGNITVNIYKGGKLYISKSSIFPQSRFEFQSIPNIWIGAVNGINEGDVIDQTMLPNIKTEITLLNTASIDIVMTGSGTDSSPLTFGVENIVHVK